MPRSAEPLAREKSLGVLPEHGNKIHREMAYSHGVMWWLKMELQFG